MSLFDKLLKKPAPAPTHALCERVTATELSPHHVRTLTEAGMKPGGGADTLALCGAKVAWDTSAVDLAELPGLVARQRKNYRYCAGCVAAAAELVG